MSTEKKSWSDLQKDQAVSQKLFAGYAQDGCREDWIVLSITPAHIKGYYVVLEEMKGYWIGGFPDTYAPIRKNNRRTRVRLLDTEKLTQCQS